MLNWSERQAVYSGMLKYMHSLGSMSDSKLMQSILDALTETELEAWQNLVESAKEPSSKRASKKSTTPSAKSLSMEEFDEMWKLLNTIGEEDYK
jgi:CHAD domain-containing protein